MNPAGKVRVPDMAEKQADQVLGEGPLDKVVCLFFDFLILAFVPWVFCLHLAYAIGLSFQGLCLVYSAILVALAVAFVFYRARKRGTLPVAPDKADGWAAVFLCTLVLAAAAVAFMAIRPDADDVNYSSRAVYFLAHPGAILDLEMHDHAFVDFPLASSVIVFEAMELFCAYVAWLFHLPYLTVYHLGLPAVGGGLIPLAWYLALRRFSRTAWGAILGTAAVCAFLALNGEPHRSFGNFSFVRIWQGKVLLMAVLTPVAPALTVDYFRKVSFRNWLRVFGVFTASAGLSSMAAFFVPFLGLCAGGAAWVAFRTAYKRPFPALVAYGTSFGYLLCVSLYAWWNLDADAVSHLGFTGYWPKTFSGQYGFVFNGILSWPSIVMAVSILLAGVFLKGRDRIFFCAWAVLAMLLFLNSMVFPLISKHVTTFNAYWRLFYLLPFPLALGLCLVALERRLSPGAMALLAGGLLVAVSGVNLISGSNATFSKISFSPGSLKLEPRIEWAARTIVAKASPGPMIAPQAFSEVIPLLSSEFPLVSVRPFTLEAAAIQHKVLDKVESRLRAVAFVSGQSPSGWEDLLPLIDRGLRNIVCDARVAKIVERQHLEERLREHGFTLVENNDTFIMYVLKKERHTGAGRYPAFFSAYAGMTTWIPEQVGF